MKKNGKNPHTNFKLGRTRRNWSFNQSLVSTVLLEMQIRRMFLFPDEFFVLIRVPSLPWLLGSSKMSFCSTTGNNFCYCLVSDSLLAPSMDFKTKVMDARGKNQTIHKV